jgi:phenylpyruvate tautomerase PptA (4-oxalocrotonate tautomerase family)
MPYVSVTTAKKLDAKTKTKLYSKLGGLIPVLPGKNLDNTLLAINDGVDMFKGGKPNDGVFVSVQCYKQSPEESKKELSEKFYAALKDVLELEEGACVYMNFSEFETWAANGNYF